MDELKRKAEEYLSIRKINMVYGRLLLLTSFGMVIWAVFNQDEDTKGQQIFFIILGLIIFFHIIRIFFFIKIPKIPNNPTHDSLKEWLIEQCKRDFILINHSTWMAITPIFMGMMAVILLEMKFGNLTFVYIGVVFILFSFAYYRLNHLEEFISKEYERLVGRRFLNW